jgi:hypothetical protein
MGKATVSLKNTTRLHWDHVQNDNRNQKHRNPYGGIRIHACIPADERVIITVLESYGRCDSDYLIGTHNYVREPSQR